MTRKMRRSSSARPAAPPTLHVVAVLLLLSSSSSPPPPFLPSSSPPSSSPPPRWSPSLLLLALAQEDEEEEVVQYEDYYCGTSWASAAQQCAKSCATGDDEECASALGDGHGCYGFTGCHAELAAAAADVGGEDVGTTADADADADADAATGTATATDSFCGLSWVDAMASCSVPCPMGGTECALPSRCYAATNCDRPLEAMVAELVVALVGPDGAMGDADMDVFGGTMFDYIREMTETEGISLGGVLPTDQRVVGARELRRRRRAGRYRSRRDDVPGGRGRHLRHDPTTTNATRWWRWRRLPSGSSAIDVSVVVTGEYRPPPYLDLDVIAEDSINRNADSVIGTLRERGRGAGAGGGSGYFDKVSGIEAVRAADATARPSGSPIGTPTLSPSVAPTADPSESPSSDPSSAPSGTPSMTLDRVITLGTAADLKIQETTTSSYGYIFNMRTKADVPLIVLTGMDFYTESLDLVNYQVWSRLGNFKDHKADKGGWDLIASGSVSGRGVGRFTAIPDETFAPVEIPGGGGDEGTRAVYITLDSTNLAYNVPDAESGYESDINIFAETPEVEIWEGEGVLMLSRPEVEFSEPPLPDPNDLIFWRKPRQFLGTIRYDRLPCRPFSAYGLTYDLPCPAIPTGSPTITPPTGSPVVPPTLSPSTGPTTAEPAGLPTGSPIIGQTPAPVGPRTDSPTTTVEPTSSPTTSEPSGSPVVPLRANVVTTLRNVPARDMTPRETEKYIELLIVFLRRYTGTTMVLDGIDMWHQEMTVVDAKEGSVVAIATTVGGVNSIDDGGEEGSVSDSSHAQEEDATQFPHVSRKEADIRARRLKASGISAEEGPTGPIRKKKETPQVTAMEVTLILKVPFSNLPSNLIGSMASVTIQEHEQTLLDLMHEQEVFYTFFKLVDGIESRVIDQVTPTPTDSPTSYEYFAAQQEGLLSVEDDAGEDSGVGIVVFVGVGIGFLWCSLTAISVTYLISARGEMKERRLMEELLKGGKANPLVAEKSDTLDDSGSLMGYDHDNEETRHAPEARVKFIKSKVRAGEDDPEGTTPRRGSAAMRSVIVTHQEKCIVLEGNTARRDITTRSGREKLNQSGVPPAKGDDVKINHNPSKSMAAKGGDGPWAPERKTAAVSKSTVVKGSDGRLHSPAKRRGSRSTSINDGNQRRSSGSISVGNLSKDGGVSVGGQRRSSAAAVSKSTVVKGCDGRLHSPAKRRGSASTGIIVGNQRRSSGSISVGNLSKDDNVSVGGQRRSSARRTSNRRSIPDIGRDEKTIKYKRDSPIL